MKIKQLPLFAILLIGTVLITACPGKVVITEGQISIEEIEVPEDCNVQMRIIIIQQNSDQASRFETSLRVEDGKLVMDLGSTSGINLEASLNIRVEVSSPQHCPPFEPGAAWDFEGKLTKEEEGKYSVKFSQFENN